MLNYIKTTNRIQDVLNQRYYYTINPNPTIEDNLREGEEKLIKQALTWKNTQKRKPEIAYFLIQFINRLNLRNNEGIKPKQQYEDKKFKTYNFIITPKDFNKCILHKTQKKHLARFLDDINKTYIFIPKNIKEWKENPETKEFYIIKPLSIIYELQKPRGILYPISLYKIQIHNLIFNPLYDILILHEKKINKKGIHYTTLNPAILENIKNKQDNIYKINSLFTRYHSTKIKNTNKREIFNIEWNELVNYLPPKYIKLNKTTKGNRITLRNEVKLTEEKGKEIRYKTINNEIKEDYFYLLKNLNPKEKEKEGRFIVYGITFRKELKNGKLIFNPNKAVIHTKQWNNNLFL